MNTPFSSRTPHVRDGRLHVPRGSSRREILQWALAGAGITALGPWIDKRLPTASAAAQGNKILVVINMDGGCDTLNMVIPITSGSYVTRRPNIHIPAAAALALTDGPGNLANGLHPQLDQIRSMWADGDVAIVHKVGYPSENLSHFESQDIYSYGVRGEFPTLGIPQSGWIARFAQQYAPTPLGAVSLGAGRPTSFVGGTSGPLQVSSLSGFSFANDNGASNNHLLRLATIKQMLTASQATGTPGEVKSAIQQAHDLTAQIQAAVTSFAPTATYPSRSLAQRLRDVAILIQGGFETRVFYTTTGGFDLHGDEGGVTGSQANLMQTIDDAISAFRTDMVAMGQWDNVVIALITEFGRRNYENGSFGSDHGAAWSEMLIGGGVNGGVFGPTIADSDIAAPKEYLTYGVDFRDVYKEILNDHLNAPAGPVFPETQPTNVVLGVC